MVLDPSESVACRTEGRGGAEAEAEAVLVTFVVFVLSSDPNQGGRVDRELAVNMCSCLVALVVVLVALVVVVALVVAVT